MASSMQYCDSCKLNVKIGLDGKSNWAVHMESAAHRNNGASKSTSAGAKLTSFFKKKLLGGLSNPLPSAIAPSLLCNPTHSFSGLFQAGPSSAPHVIDTLNNELIVIDLDGLPPSPTIASSAGAGAGSTTSLLLELKRVSVSLSLSTSEGTEMDILAWFSGNPALELKAGEDAWEMAD